MGTKQDFTKLGLKLQGAWENDRNAESRDLIKAIVRECHGEVDCIVAHHIAYVAKEKRVIDGHEYEQEIIEEIPSMDTLIFDHATARKLWGEDHMHNALARLAMEPETTRDALLARMLANRDKLTSIADNAPSEHTGLNCGLLPCGMADRKA